MRIPTLTPGGRTASPQDPCSSADPFRRLAAGPKSSRSGTDQPAWPRPPAPLAALRATAPHLHQQGSPADSHSAAQCALARRPGSSRRKSVTAAQASASAKARSFSLGTAAFMGSAVAFKAGSNASSTSQEGSRRPQQRPRPPARMRPNGTLAHPKREIPACPPRRPATLHATCDRWYRLRASAQA